MVIPELCVRSERLQYRQWQRLRGTDGEAGVRQRRQGAHWSVAPLSKHREDVVTKFIRRAD